MNQDFLDRLADATPTPGGGSAAAFTAAEAAALVAMTAKLTIGKKQYLEIHEEMAISIEKAEKWREILADYVEIDAIAFEQIISAKRLPRQTRNETSNRDIAVEKAVFRAAEVPLEMSRICIQVMSEAVRMAAKANINVIADAACAVSLCMAAITTANNNVKINLAACREQENAQAMIAEMNEIFEQADAYNRQVQVLMETRGGI